MDPLLRQGIEEAVNSAKNGSKEAFRIIFEHLSDRLFSYALSRTSVREDALDIVQDTFIELWGALKNFQYRSDEQFYGFVFTIVKRKLYRHYGKRHATVPLDDEIIGESFEMNVEDYRYLLKHVNVLASHHQELLQLRYWAGMTFAEIASILNIKEATAKVWHHRAIRKLQFLLKQHERTI